MATIITRAGKEAPLTNAEVDSNFTNLNTDKAETDGATLTNVDINSGTIDGVTIGGASAGVGTFTNLTADGLTAIAASANTDIAIFDGATGNGTRGLKISTEADNAADQVVVLSAQYDGAVDGYFKFKTADIERLRLDKNGDINFYASDGTTKAFHWDAADERLGIGTTSPAQLAHLFEATADTGAFLQVQETGGQNAYFGVNTSGGSIQVSGANPLQIATNGTERMRIDSSGTTFGSRFQNFTGSSDPWFKGTDSGGTETSFIKKDGSAFFDGNVGIGTTSPSDVLELTADGIDFGLLINNPTNNPSRITLTNSEGSSIIDANNNLLRFNQSGSADAVIDSSGNVGIGTTGPQSKLDVAGSSGGVLTLKSTATSVVAADEVMGQIDFYTSDSSTNNTGVFAKIDAASSRLFDGDSVSGMNLRFFAGDIGDGAGTPPERMRITTEGRVGIGTTSPSTNLDFGITSNNSWVVTTRKNGNSVNAIGVNSDFGMRFGAPSDVTSGNALLSFGSISTSDGSTFSEKMRITPSGNLDMTNGGGDIIMANGAGIDFGASEGSGADGGDGSVLDDYEEGTFTPTLTAVANCSSLSVTSAWYIKVGGLVTYSIRGSITVTSSNTKTAFQFTQAFSQSANADPQGGSAIIEGPNPFPYASGNVMDSSLGNSNGFVAFGASAVDFNGASSFHITGSYKAD